MKVYLVQHGEVLSEDPDQPVIEFTKGDIVCLSTNEERWQASWILLPEMAEQQTAPDPALGEGG